MIMFCSYSRFLAELDWIKIWLLMHSPRNHLSEKGATPDVNHVTFEVRVPSTVLKTIKLWYCNPFWPPSRRTLRRFGTCLLANFEMWGRKVTVIVTRSASALQDHIMTAGPYPKSLWDCWNSNFTMAWESKSYALGSNRLMPKKPGWSPTSRWANHLSNKFWIHMPKMSSGTFNQGGKPKKKGPHTEILTQPSIHFHAARMIEACVTSDEVQTMCESIGIDVWDAPWYPTGTKNRPGEIWNTRFRTCFFILKKGHVFFPNDFCFDFELGVPWVQ